MNGQDVPCFTQHSSMDIAFLRYLMGSQAHADSRGWLSDPVKQLHRATVLIEQ